MESICILQKFEKTFAEQRKFPYGLKEIQYLYDVGRSQVILSLNIDVL